MHTVGLRGLTVNKILVLATNHNLASDCNLIGVFIAGRACATIRVVENNRNSSLCYTSLALFVYEILHVLRANLAAIVQQKEGWKVRRTNNRTVSE